MTGQHKWRLGPSVMRNKFPGANIISLLGKLRARSGFLGYFLVTSFSLPPEHRSTP